MESSPDQNRTGKKSSLYLYRRRCHRADNCTSSSWGGRREGACPLPIPPPMRIVIHGCASPLSGPVLCHDMNEYGVQLVAGMPLYPYDKTLVRIVRGSDAAPGSEQGSRDIPMSMQHSVSQVNFSRRSHSGCSSPYHRSTRAGGSPLQMMGEMASVQCSGKQVT
jgi:hypothetical protein